MLDIVRAFADASGGFLACFFLAGSERGRGKRPRGAPATAVQLKRSPHSFLEPAAERRARQSTHRRRSPAGDALAHTEQDRARTHRCKRGDGRGSVLATGTSRGEPPGRGRTGHPPAGSRSHPRPPQVPLASHRILHPLARGVDIIACDYVKVDRRSTRRREPARARSDKAALSDRAARAVTGSPTIFYIREPGAALGTRDEALPGRPIQSHPGRGRLPPELGAGDIQAQASRPPGWAGVLNPDAESPRTGIPDQDSGPRRLLLLEKHPNTRRRARGLPHPLHPLQAA